MSFLGSIFKRTNKKSLEQEPAPSIETIDLHRPVVEAEALARYLTKKEPLTPLELEEIQVFLADLKNAESVAMAFVRKIPGGELHLNNKSTNPKIHLLARKVDNINEVVIDQQQEHITSRATFAEGLSRNGIVQPRMVLEDENADIDLSTMEVRKRTKTKIQYSSDGSSLVPFFNSQRAVITQNIIGDLGAVYGNIESKSVIAANPNGSITTSYQDFMSMETVVFSYDEYGVFQYRQVIA